MKKHLLLVLLYFLTLTGFAQTHQVAKMFDSSFPFYVTSSATDNLGNIYVTGYFSGTVDVNPGTGTYNLTSSGSTPYTDIFVVKLDPGFNFVWAFKIGTNGGTYQAKSIAHSAGTIIIGGEFTYSGVTDFNPGSGTANLTGHGTSTEGFVMKVDVNGNFIWAKQLGTSNNERIDAIATDATGNVLLTGVYVGTLDMDPGNGVYPSAAASANNEVFVIKLNAAGDFVWGKRFQNNSGSDEVYAIATDANKNIYTAIAFSGSIYCNPASTPNLTSAGSYDILISKLDSNGIYTTHFVLGTANDEKALTISCGTAGEIHIGGRFQGTMDFDPSGATNNETAVGGTDCFLAKYSTAGAYAWSTGLGSSSGATESITDIAVDGSNNIFITGGLNNDPFIFKYNSAGALQGATGGVMGGPGVGTGTTVSLTPWGDIYTGGQFTGGSTDFNPGTGTDSLTADNYNGFVEKLSSCQTASTPTIIASSTQLCGGGSDTLRIATGNLNGSGTWGWYTGSCGGAAVGTGFQVIVNPTVSTTYYVRGTLGCATTNGACGSLAITVSAQVTPSVAVTVSPGTNICAGVSVTFTANPTNGGTSPQYQWKKNGTNISGATAATYSSSSLVNNDVITCLLTSGNVCASPTIATSNGVTMTVSSVVPNINISANPSASCAGENIAFTSSITNGGGSPSYQWQRNGVNISGATSATYSSTSLANNDQVRCILTSTATCASPNKDTSTALVLTITPSVVPTIAITVTNDTVCTGNTATFTASITNGGNSPVYTWKRNGTTVGVSQNTFTTSTINTGDIFTCQLQSSATCAVPATVTSNSITMASIATVTPVINVTYTPAGTSCQGTTINFNTTASGGGTAPQYQWKKNGANISGATATTYSSSSLANNDQISCVLTSNLLCLSTNSTTSNVVILSIAPVTNPAVVISATQNTICSGNTVTFTATATDGGTTPSYQWKLNNANISGATGSTYTSSSLANGDQVTCQATTSAACATAQVVTSNTITITVSGTVTPAITVTTSVDSACAGEQVIFTANQTNGGGNPQYQWKRNGNDISGAVSSAYTTGTIQSNDVFSCVLTSSVSCASPTTATSSGKSIIIRQNFTPTAFIAPSVSSACEGVNVDFTSTVTGAGSTPLYQWKVNGADVNGAAGNTFSTTALLSGDEVTLQLSSSDACALPVVVTSAPAALAINPLVTPAVTIGASQTTICTGSSVVFTAAVTNGGTAPSYQWKINGNNVSGQTNPTFTTTSLIDGDEVTCEITGNAACATVSTAISGGVILTENSNVIASVTIASGSNAVCNGQQVTFTATPVNGGAGPTYQWIKNNVNVSGATSATYTEAAPANNDAFKCEMVSNASCVQQPTVVSNQVQLTVNALPDATVTVAANVLSVPPAATHQWFDCSNNIAIAGATAGTYTANANGSYAVVVTSGTGCADTSECVSVTGVGVEEIAIAQVSVYPNPTTGVLVVNLAGFYTPVDVQLTDLVGRVMYVAGNFTGNQLHINIEQAEGVYLLGIRTPNGSNKTLRVVKQ